MAISKKKRFSRRKNPSQDRSRATVQRITEATWDILQTQGAKAVTTRNIAARSGVTIGSIYQYFPHKEAILLELYQERLAQVRDTFHLLMTPEMIALGPIKWHDLYTEAFDKLGWNQRGQLELNKACRFDQALEKLHEKHFARMQGQITEVYRRFFPNTDVEVVRVLSKFFYGLERLEAELLQSETGAGRKLVRELRTDTLLMLFHKFQR